MSDFYILSFVQIFVTLVVINLLVGFGTYLLLLSIIKSLKHYGVRFTVFFNRISGKREKTRFSQVTVLLGSFVLFLLTTPLPGNLGIVLALFKYVYKFKLRTIIFCLLVGTFVSVLIAAVLPILFGVLF